MPHPHVVLLVVHGAAGALGLALGPVAMWRERFRPGSSDSGLAYCWSVCVVALTAGGLVALDPASLWWLLPLAVLACALALLGRWAPRRRRRGWERSYAHGQGGSYVSLVSALLVVSIDGPAQIAAWVLPTAVGLVLIERRVGRLRRGDGGRLGAAATVASA